MKHEEPLALWALMHPRNLGGVYHSTDESQGARGAQLVQFLVLCASGAHEVSLSFSGTELWGRENRFAALADNYHGWIPRVILRLGGTRMNWSQSPRSPWKKWFGWGWSRFSFLNPHHIRRVLQDRTPREKQDKEKPDKKKSVHVQPPKDEK